MHTWKQSVCTTPARVVKQYESTVEDPPASQRKKGSVAFCASSFADCTDSVTSGDRRGIHWWEQYGCLRIGGQKTETVIFRSSGNHWYIRERELGPRTKYSSLTLKREHKIKLFQRTKTYCGLLAAILWLIMVDVVRWQCLTKAHVGLLSLSPYRRVCVINIGNGAVNCHRRFSL